MIFPFHRNMHRPPDYTEFFAKARYTDLSVIIDWITQQSQGVSLSKHLDAKISLVLEELFTNTINHGYAQECDLPIRVRYAYNCPELIIQYADQASAFYPEPDTSVPQNTRVGGNGLYLIRDIPERIEYRQENGWNVTEILFVNKN